MHNEIANITDHYNYAPRTNGEWIVIPDQSSASPSLYIYKLENNVPTLNQTIEGPDYDKTSFFPGNVFVGERPGYLGIYAYNGTAWTFVADFDLGDHIVAPIDQVTQDGKFVITYNASSVNIFEFVASGPTFKLIETIEADTATYQIALYNGVDTMVLTSLADLNFQEIYGYLKFYQKVNGVWTSGQQITAASLGLRTVALMGQTGKFIDANTLVVSAPADNSGTVPKDASGPAGKVVVITRNDTGVWQQSYQLNATEQVFFGLNVAINDQRELVVPGLTFGSVNEGYLYSSCLTTAINVTCKDIQLDDCTTIPTDTLYTVNNPQCGTVTAHPTEIQEQNNVIVAFKFDKFGLTATCNSTVTCSATPPGALPAASPVTGPAASVNGPMGLPGKAPTGMTSGAVVVELSIVLLMVVLAVY